MNIVLSGPFGLGSLSDEIVLAGVLRPLLAAKHSVTVLSADKAATATLHGVEAIALPSPAGLMTSTPAWKALDKAHFFGICGAGVIGSNGKIPARVWLAQLEYARQMKMATAVIGAGAVAIDDKKECVRAQRFLHHYADGVSVRDDASKLALVGYGLNANRISSTGDPTLALFHDESIPKPAAGAAVRAAFFFADGIPHRQTFAPDPTIAPAPLARGLNALVKALNANGTEAVVFHDGSRQNRKLAQSIADGAEAGKAMLLGPDVAMTALRAGMASCSVAITDTLHGVLFAAVHGVPAVFLNERPEPPITLDKLGLTDFSIPADAGGFDPDRALAVVNLVLRASAELRITLVSAVAVLAKKEAQNARMIEKLVPKRNRYPKGESGD